MRDLSRDDEAVDTEQETSTASRDLEKDMAVSNKAESQGKDEQPAREEDTDAQTETESTQASAIEKGSNHNEGTVDTDTGSKAESEKESSKTEETAAEATKGSSSVEGDDQKKRFVVLCLLEQNKTMAMSVTLVPFVNSFFFSFWCTWEMLVGLRIFVSKALIFVVTPFLSSTLFPPHSPPLSNALQISLAALSLFERLC